MRIALQTWGSRGDVRPFFALARALIDAGHDVRLVVTSPDRVDYSPLSAALDVPFTLVCDSVEYDTKPLLRSFGRIRSSARLLRLLLDEAFFPFTSSMHQAALDLCADSDLLVHHFLLHPAAMAALETSTPHASLAFWPAIVPSRSRPPFHFPDLGPLLNRLSWSLVHRYADHYLKAPIARDFLAAGLPAPRHVISDAWLSPSLNLIAASPLVFPEPPDWPPVSFMCGPLDVPPEADSFSVSPYLEDFLDSDPPPAFLTMGTMQRFGSCKNTSLLFAAARLAGCRAIVYTTCEDFPPGTVRDNVCFVGPVPYHLVFPRCAAILHHGGAGTMHFALSSRRPSFIVAFAGEQFFRGLATHRLGVGPAPLYRDHATPERLASRLRAALDSADMASRAADCAKIVRAENGPATAVRLIEETFS